MKTLSILFISLLFLFLSLSLPSLKSNHKMQFMLNLRVTHGLPLSLSGITNPFSFSKEIADHDSRRKTMKMQRSVGREGVHANRQQKGILITNFETCSVIMAEEYGDLDDVILHYLFYTHLDLTAKAA